MSFVIDTDIALLYLRGDRRVQSRLMQYAGGLHVSIVTLAELYTWAYKPGAASRLSVLQGWLVGVTTLALDQNVAELSGRIRAAMLATGSGIVTPDAMIACTALYHNFTLVTHNTRHFGKVPGLRIADWSQP